MVSMMPDSLGIRPGSKAVARHVRVSASKARAVLDLVRGLSYSRAAEIVAFSERSVAGVVGKCLESAVANAEHNDQIPAEELFVSACYADEGPTLKRWRPRARGRATPINKRTCHITMVVSRYTAEELETSETNSSRAGVSRRERVERSRSAEAPSDDSQADDVVATSEPPSRSSDNTEVSSVEESAAEDGLVAENEQAEVSFLLMKGKSTNPVISAGTPTHA